MRTGDAVSLLQLPAYGNARPWVRTAVLRPELGSLVAAALLFIFFSIASSGAMLEVPTIARVLDIAWPYGIIAVAVGLLMISGEFDLSAGVMVGTAGALLGVMATEWGMNLWAAVFLSLLVCLALGLWNGVLVVWTGLPSFVITLGTFFGLRGANVALSKYFTGDALIENIDDAGGYHSLHTIVATVFGTAPSDFRVSLIWWAAFILIATWILWRTKIGNWIFASGGDRDAARAVGVPVNGTKIGLFMLTAGAAWFVGVSSAIRYTSVQAGQGVGQEFFYIIAAVVGGCRMAGGYGSAVGPAIGALIWGIAFVGIPHAGWNSDWRWAFLGVLLLVATLINHVVGERVRTARSG
ncbi:MAG: ABC transporter permease [Chloroflexi bacterium]|nr:ABC transporter permease [Chloroflexota bacterium]MYD15963.1 ABC transporter permease [Chloroflexota bacterium]